MSEHSEIIVKKIADKQMRQNLDSAMHTLQKNRKNLIASNFTNWQTLREQGKNAKQKALNNLSSLTSEFIKNAENNGFILHFAKDAKEACECVYNLMKEKGIDTILKGKSMASEEIHLNHYLKERGLNPLETDLGEVIIQLLDEPPVHIVVPAIHKNRYEVGEIFASKWGVKKESEPEKLNAIARTKMRDEFKKLKMGLSGVNFAIANEGAIWLIENEGNGRMSTTMPDIHIAICGIEKIVQTIEDAATVDTLLCPSATGQFISNYNNIIAGPRKQGELDGPKECHIILLDNGRSDMLAHDEFSEALRCIRCGACMNFCPVYDKIGGHSYRAVYPGPIGEVISPQLFGMDKYSDITELCSLCGRCSEVCPVEIPLADLIRKLRRDKNNPQTSKLKTKTKRKLMQSLVFLGYSKVATSPSKWRGMLSIASKADKMIHKIKFLPILKSWQKYKELPNLKNDLNSQISKFKGVIYE
ncbi:LutB/LldF family L-lactate oxidation iron-sulfur protein [Campylobacter hyointestinalis]|uniref:LutB/LldF family L-lactate oxidation iron-sulfur protein n=1 Tax=Campylobacter hyointestinalis TaxID=198 RepID=UPI000DCBBE08|nr:LutB/LldF family L-lactate oxidation iron-sulfur protein [Campylobacter hyointestinalis]RAZ51757.1 iron-sulfur cluster-binding protein [Campylobacter hyointestinalis subsp. lawsonii]